MDKLTKLAGGLALVSLGYFLYKTGQEKEEGMNHIDGLNVEVNPERLIDGGLAFVRMNPDHKEMLGNFARGAVSRYLTKGMK